MHSTPHSSYHPMANSSPTTSSDVFGPNTSRGQELPQEPPPSLVAQLQQVHGLTKKKVYGVKPVRRPFIRDEPVAVGVPSRRSSLISSSSSSPPETHHLPPTPISPGGRAASQLATDRSTRVRQRTQGKTAHRSNPTSPTDTGAFVWPRSTTKPAEAYTVPSSPVSMSGPSAFDKAHVARDYLRTDSDVLMQSRDNISWKPQQPPSLVPPVIPSHSSSVYPAPPLTQNHAIQQLPYPLTHPQIPQNNAPPAEYIPNAVDVSHTPRRNFAVQPLSLPFPIPTETRDSSAVSSQYDSAEEPRHLSSAEYLAATLGSLGNKKSFFDIANSLSSASPYNSNLMSTPPDPMTVPVFTNDGRYTSYLPVAQQPIPYTTPYTGPESNADGKVKKQGFDHEQTVQANLPVSGMNQQPYGLTRSSSSSSLTGWAG